MSRNKTFGSYGMSLRESASSNEENITEEYISNNSDAETVKKAEVETSFEPAAETIAEPKTETGTAIKSISAQGAVEKIIKHEKNLEPKYTSVQDAIDSIVKNGEYFEDYIRGENAELCKSKEFVLAILAQNHNRFFAPQTPKPSDWIDEEYLCAKISYFFDETKESIKPQMNSEFAENLFNYLTKSSFSAESYEIISRLAKLVAKVNIAKTASSEENERLKESLSRFNSALSSALSLAKDKHNAFITAENEKAAKLAEGKSGLVDMVESMTF